MTDPTPAPSAAPDESAHVLSTNGMGYFWCSCNPHRAHVLWSLNEHIAEIVAAARAGDADAQPTPPSFLYHWSPVANRSSIEREGLRPGSPSNTFPEWSAPHVCYGETPSAALGLTLLDVALDLWMVRTEGYPFSPANDDQEWRSTHTVRTWYVGTREMREGRSTHRRAGNPYRADPGGSA